MGSPPVRDDEDGPALMAREPGTYRPTECLRQAVGESSLRGSHNDQRRVGFRGELGEGTGRIACEGLKGPFRSRGAGRHLGAAVPCRPTPVAPGDVAYASDSTAAAAVPV